MNLKNTNTAYITLLSVTLGVFASCAYDDGSPWGEVAFQLSVSSALDTRADDGRFRTAQDFDVTLDRFDIVVEQLAMDLAAEGALSFDPADPPPGYGLCHNGHCHADDGRLVPYEEIQMEVSGSSGGITLDVEQLVEVDPFTVREVAVPYCGADCDLERGTLAQVSVVLHEVTLEGTAYDVPGFPERVGTDGVPFAVTVHDVRIAIPIEGEVGQGSLPGINTDLQLELPATLFDDIDWGSVVPDELNTAIAARLLESRLDAHIERNDL